MKQIRCAVLVAIIAFLTICAPRAFAFQVNPCYRVLEIKNGVPDQGRIRAWFINTCWLKNDFHTVHEHLTNFAINEYLVPAYYLRNPKVALVNRASGDSVNFITDAEWPKEAKPQHTTYGIIYGSWWNDDPLMFTWGEGANFTTGLLKLKRQFEDTHAEYRGGVSGCWVKTADYLPWLEHNGWVPNNPRLPVLIYLNAIVNRRIDLASQFEETFSANGWPPQWRNGVYGYHHYHTEGHEVLGIASGHARLILGGPDGFVVQVRAGDALLLPAGTGHCSLDSSDDFLVVAAYPPRQQADMCREAPSKSQLASIDELPFPDLDPVQGMHGAIHKYWANQHQ